MVWRVCQGCGEVCKCVRLCPKCVQREDDETIAKLVPKEARRRPARFASAIRPTNSPRYAGPKPLED